MKLIDRSLRKHIVLIVLIKLALIIAIRVTLFPSLEQQHPPSDIYFQTSQEPPSLRSQHD